MSNTDGEDTQKVSLGELLLNAGTRIVDLEKQSNDQVEIITHLEKQLASLREQIAGAEQQIKSLNEIIENLMNDEKDDMINLREQLKLQEEINLKLHDAMVTAERRATEKATKEFEQQLKHKEDENREQLIEFKRWYDKLTPAQKCTVWPPAGSGIGTGLYTMEDSDLIDKFLSHKKKNLSA